MRAAVGVFFGTYSGYADACRKLGIGEPARATPHIVYYSNKIKASVELQCALRAQHEAEAAREAAPAGTNSPDAPANTPAAGVAATAATAANQTTPRPRHGYMGCGGTFKEYQVPCVHLAHLPQSPCAPTPDSIPSVAVADIGAAAASQTGVASCSAAPGVAG